jgi:hypothetical protein
MLGAELLPPDSQLLLERQLRGVLGLHMTECTQTESSSCALDKCSSCLDAKSLQIGMAFNSCSQNYCAPNARSDQAARRRTRLGRNLRSKMRTRRTRRSSKNAMMAARMKRFQSCS